MLEHLIRHFGQWVPHERLVAVTWADDPNGGPLWIKSATGVTLNSLRKKVAPYGLEIEGKSWFGSRLKWKG